MPLWYRRLADVPGVGYLASAQVDRGGLTGHDAVPKVSVYEFDGERKESLSWSLPNGTTSASPAQRHATAEQNEPTPALLRRVRETLELPGEPSNYHFALLNACEELWQRRRESPHLFEELEDLCLLDIRLIEAQPQIVTNTYGNGPDFFQVPAFGRLIQLYEREGFLHEALKIAERAEHFGQMGVRLQELRDRVATIEHEASHV